MNEQPHSELKPFLNRLNLRSVLNEEEQFAILSLPTHVAQVPANIDFVGLGEHTHSSCMIVEGLACRFDQDLDGQRQIIALHIPGDFADLHSLVQPRASSGLQALAITTLVRVPHRALHDVAARYPAIAEAFWRDCMIDASIMGKWLANLGLNDAKSRLAHLLCELAVRFRGEGETHALRFALPLTQTHLANATGMTPVHINRSLKSLADIVRVGKGKVQIADWSRLERIGKFTAGYLGPQGRLNSPQLA